MHPGGATLSTIPFQSERLSYPEEIREPIPHGPSAASRQVGWMNRTPAEAGKDIRLSLLMPHPEGLVASGIPRLDALRLLGAIVESSDDAILAKDLNGSIMSWNAGAENLYGYPAAEVVGRSVSLLVPPEMEDDTKVLLARLRAGESVRHYETVRMARDGRRLRVSLTISPIHDETGRIVGASTIARNVTRVHVERQRLALLSQLNQILSRELEGEQVLRKLAVRLVPELADYSVTYLLEDGDVRRIGAAHIAPEKDPLLRRLLALPSPRLNDQGGPGSVVRTGQPMLVANVADGDLRGYASGEYLEILEALGPLSSIIVPLRARRRIIGALVFATTAESKRRYDADDLTFAQEIADHAALTLDNARLFGQAQIELRRREKAESRLRAQLEQLRTLYEMTEAAARSTQLSEIYERALEGIGRSLSVDRSSILLFDEDGILRFEAWRGLSDSYRAEVEGHSPWSPDTVDPTSIMVPDVSSAAGIEPGLRATILEEGIRAIAFVPLTFGSQLLGKFMLYYDRPRELGPDEIELARTIAGTIAFAIIRMRNEQSLLQAKSEAERANRSKLAFLGMMSHELRTPLNAIAGYVELLHMGIHGELTEDQQETLSRIGANQRHLMTLINDILSFARIEAGQVEYVFRDLTVREALADLEPIVTPLAAGARVRYEVQDDVDGLHVRADEERMRQILINLVTNAMKFTPEGGRVKVECGRRDGWAELRVRDTGGGIAHEHQARIFEPFFQLDRQTRSGAGVGLGLAISREFARGMGGDIFVESALGEGSTFIVRLPLASEGVA